jgi:hypothetical protein
MVHINACINAPHPSHSGQTPFPGPCSHQGGAYSATSYEEGLPCSHQGGAPSATSYEEGLLLARLLCWGRQFAGDNHVKGMDTHQQQQANDSSSDSYNHDSSNISSRSSSEGIHEKRLLPTATQLP